MGTGTWGQERGYGDMGTGAWVRGHGYGDMGTGTWVQERVYGDMGRERGYGGMMLRYQKKNVEKTTYSI